MKWGTEYPAKHDLSSLRLLGSVGEPINPEAWMWYREWIGGNRTPVVRHVVDDGNRRHHDHAAARHHDAAAGFSATRPFPGIHADVVDEKGNSVPLGGGGYAVITRPWPGMLRGIWGDDERYKQTYWSKFPGKFFAGDGCKRDKDGNYWFMGRIDDVMNVSGHRISTTEIESALVDHPKVAEAAVCGKTRRHDRTGDLRVRLAQARATPARPSSPTSCAITSPNKLGKFTRPEIHHVHARTAQDAQRQDHAPPAARHRRRTHPRRYHDACRFERSCTNCKNARRSKPAKTESWLSSRA